METARVGKVAVENTAYHFDKAYDYLIPQTLWAKAEKGCRVLVPFGGGNRTRQGLLMDVEEIRAGRTGSEEGLKSVKAVLDQTPLRFSRNASPGPVDEGTLISVLCSTPSG